MKKTNRKQGIVRRGSGQEDAGDPFIHARGGATPGEGSGLEEEIEALRKEVGNLRQREAERILVEESLNESEERYRNLLQSTRDGIIVNNESGIIIEWNSGMEQIFGIPREEAIGRSIQEIASLVIPPDVRIEERVKWLPVIIEDLDNNEAKATGTPVEVPIRRSDGTIRIIEAKNFDFKDQGCILYGGIVRDITERRRAEETLVESEEELQNLIESSGDGIIITDEEGRITKWNKSIELITGLTPEEVLWKPAWEIQALHSIEDSARKNSQEYYRTAWDNILQDESDKRYKDLFVGKIRTVNEEVRYIQQRVFRIPGRKGFRIGAIIRDITEMKRHENVMLESEEKYRTLVELSPDVIVIHRDGKIVYVNPAIGKMLRTSSPERLIGMDIFTMIHPDYHDIVRQNTAADLEGSITRLTELQVIRGDGTPITLEGSGRRILFEGQPAVQVVLRDITDRKSAELQLKEYAENLKRSNEDLELFAYIATHDLQEPIRGIVAYSQLLLAECKAEHSSQTKKYLENIARDGLRLNSLVSDLREYLKVRSGAKPFAPTDMEEVFSNALKTLHREIGETQASITHNPLPVVYADSAQITRVLLNLLSNAMKFHKKEVIPEIHVFACLDDGTWQFAVSDNGIGIPKEYHSKLFVLFERLHQRDTYPGTGLGLALSRRIIERHGGRMWVESATGNGSTFYFTLPLDPHEVVI